MMKRCQYTVKRNKHDSKDNLTTAQACGEIPVKIGSCHGDRIDPCHPEPRIVIIGAGIAGLSAAAHLNQCGINKFIILEATARPGGRIHSCWMGDVIAELGPQWIVGACLANPLYTLAAQEGLLKTPLLREDITKDVFYTTEGRAISQGVTLVAKKSFVNIVEEARSLFSIGSDRSHETLQNYFSKKILKELQNYPPDTRYDASCVLHGLSNWLRWLPGDDLSKVAADQFGSHVSIPGGKIRVPLGYFGILAPLFRDLPEKSIRYNKPVQQVRWGTLEGAGPRAIIKCCDGESFHADYVISTMSLGVLKTQADKIFCPSLPSRKIEAINKLGYGHTNKIFLEYTRPFWVWQEGNIRLGWSADELQDRNDWVKGLSIIEQIPGSRHVICCCVAGPEAAVMEQATDDQVAELCTKVLRRFTGDPSLPYPNSILRSKWSSDPRFCGGVSYMSLQSNVVHQCDLGSPEPENCHPVLLFAGEATCPGFYGLAHGARLTGIREAERIIQLVKTGKGVPSSDILSC